MKSNINNSNLSLYLKVEKQMFIKRNKQSQEILIHNKRQFPVSHKDKQFYEIPCNK